jgi:hypothetical protein
MFVIELLSHVPFCVLEAFGLVGWDQRLLSRAGPPIGEAKAAEACTPAGGQRSLVPDELRKVE